MRLEPVEVGKDDDGDPISSCVVVEEAGGAKPSAAPGRRLNDRQRLAVAALNEAVINFGKPAPASFNLPNSPLAVPSEREQARGQSHRILQSRTVLSITRSKARRSDQLTLQPQNFLTAPRQLGLQKA